MEQRVNGGGDEASMVTKPLADPVNGFSPEEELEAMEGLSLLLQWKRKVQSQSILPSWKFCKKRRSALDNPPPPEKIICTKRDLRLPRPPLVPRILLHQNNVAQIQNLEDDQPSTKNIQLAFPSFGFPAAFNLHRAPSDHGTTPSATEKKATYAAARRLRMLTIYSRRANRAASSLSNSSTPKTHMEPGPKID